MCRSNRSPHTSFKSKPTTECVCSIMPSTNVFVDCARRGDVAGLRICLRAVARSPAGHRAVDAFIPGGWAPIHYCADRPDSVGTAMLGLLITAGADVNLCVESTRLTPLMLATDASNNASARLLLESGACVSAVDRRGWTTLHFAARRGLPQIVAWALALGADASAPARGGTLPLHLAACSGAADAVTVAELLCLRGGARVDARDNIAGDTPLHIAARCGNQALVDALARLGGAGACSVPNRAGDDAVSTAARSGHASLASGLRRSLAVRRRLWLLRLCSLLARGRAVCVGGPPVPALVETLPEDAEWGGFGEDGWGLGEDIAPFVPEKREGVAAAVSCAGGDAPPPYRRRHSSDTGEGGADAGASDDDPAPPQALAELGGAPYTFALPHAEPSLPEPTQVYPWPPAAEAPLGVAGGGGGSSSTAAHHGPAAAAVEAAREEGRLRRRPPARLLRPRVRYSFTAGTVAAAIVGLSTLPLPLIRHVVEFL